MVLPPDNRSCPRCGEPISFHERRGPWPTRRYGERTCFSLQYQIVDLIEANERNQ